MVSPLPRLATGPAGYAPIARGWLTLEGADDALNDAGQVHLVEVVLPVVPPCQGRRTPGAECVRDGLDELVAFGGCASVPPPARVAHPLTEVVAGCDDSHGLLFLRRCPAALTAIIIII